MYLRIYTYKLRIYVYHIYKLVMNLVLYEALEVCWSSPTCRYTTITFILPYSLLCMQNNGAAYNMCTCYHYSLFSLIPLISSIRFLILLSIISSLLSCNLHEILELLICQVSVCSMCCILFVVVCVIRARLVKHPAGCFFKSRIIYKSRIKLTN